MSLEKVTAIVLSALLFISTAVLLLVYSKLNTSMEPAMSDATPNVTDTAVSPETDSGKGSDILDVVLPESEQMTVEATEVLPATEVISPSLHDEKVLAEVERIISTMTLHDKICQMFIVYPTHVPNLAAYPVGGLVYSASHLSSDGEAVKRDISSRQDQSAIPLLICVDEEGGIVSRVMKKLGTTQLDDMFSYKDEGTLTAYGNAAIIAEDISRFGFNTDFAPIADVWSNPENTVIGSRAYSDNFEEAAKLVESAVYGFKSRGVICTLKHFPGHGDTEEDSHNTAAYVNKSLDELRREEFVPFMAGIAAGADMVMIGHLTLPSISREPATVSYEIVTNILRLELGFDGVIISDGLEMDAVSLLYTDSELCVAAVQAGIDILLGPGSLAESVSALEAAVANDRITEERIDESVRRILLMKLENELFRDY